MKIIPVLLLLLTSCLNRNTRQSQDELEIRQTRQLSNDAIARHDTLALADYWTDDFHIISSRNFEISGRTDNQHSFAQEFNAKREVIYVRTPQRIDVFKAWNMAAETGTWTGQWKEEDGSVLLEGNYYAKWHFVDRQWKIRAEVFTPLRCSGSKFCDQLPAL